MTTVCSNELVSYGAGLETTISENRSAIFGRTGPTGQRGPPFEVYNFDRKISTWAEPFHLRLDEISGNFCIVKEPHDFFFISVTVTAFEVPYEVLTFETLTLVQLPG